MSLASGTKGRPVSTMDKKIHENPRYKHVGKTLDTGSSKTKLDKKIEDSKNNFKYQHGEIFKRMKCSTFIQLVIQVETFVEQRTLSPIQDDDETLPPTPRPVDEVPDTARSCDSRFSNVIRGVGELDVNKPAPIMEEKPEKPYLLLDVRDSDAFDKCRITGAVNFPSAMLSRAQNYFTKQVLDYINKEGRIIIIYDEDERLAQVCTTTMIERGVDNIFMLSGGLKVLHQRFPTGIIRGPIPKVCLPEVDNKNRRAKMKQDLTPASEHPMGDKFSEEDMEALEETLDQIMLNQAPSRMGGMSRAQSKLSQMSEGQSKAWK